MLKSAGKPRYLCHACNEEISAYACDGACYRVNGDHMLEYYHDMCVDDFAGMLRLYICCICKEQIIPQQEPLLRHLLLLPSMALSCNGDDRTLVYCGFRSTIVAVSAWARSRALDCLKLIMRY